MTCPAQGSRVDTLRHHQATLDRANHTKSRDGAQSWKKPMTRSGLVFTPLGYVEGLLAVFSPFTGLQGPEQSDKDLVMVFNFMVTSLTRDIGRAIVTATFVASTAARVQLALVVLLPRTKCCMIVEE